MSTSCLFSTECTADNLAHSTCVIKTWTATGKHLILDWGMGWSRSLLELIFSYLFLYFLYNGFSFINSTSHFFSVMILHIVCIFNFAAVFMNMLLLQTSKILYVDGICHLKSKTKKIETSNTCCFSQSCLLWNEVFPQLNVWHSGY